MKDFYPSKRSKYNYSYSASTKKKFNTKIKYGEGIEEEETRP
jgi:hypothetical protein